MDDSCAVCADSMEWVAYGSCGHREVCSTCVVRLRFVLDDRRCCICKTESPTVFVTKAMGDYTRVITDFSAFPPGASEGQVGSFWYHEDSQAYFDDVDQYRMIKAMCKLSCSICDKIVDEQGNESTKRRSKFRNIDQLKGHLFHQHKMFMCSLCMEGRKVFICEQKLYTRSQLNKHISTGDSEVDGTGTERGGFMGHPMCEFCRNPFYGDNELYMHMSTEHYTCHICQRQHPGQYDYFRNYDDLEIHFRQEHFLCEDEACLAKKFIVFQSEAEMKRHNTIEHGGHMSRSKRNAALQIPTSFSYRRNDQEQRRGRGRGFWPEPSNNQLSMAIQASLETATADGRVRESSSGTQPVSGRGETSREVDRDRSSLESTVNSGPELTSRSNSAHGQSSRSTHILDDSYFPPLTDRELPAESSSRYAQVLHIGTASRLGEESFPPLPGMKEGSSSKAKNASEALGNNTLASHLNRKKGSVKVLHSARPKPPQVHDLDPSNSASFPLIRSTQNHGLTPSTSNPKPQASTNQVAKSSTSARENRFVSPVSAKTAWNSASENKMRHSLSAPSLVDASNQHMPSLGSASLGKQAMPASTPTLPSVEDVHTANKSLVERIRAGVGNDDEKFAAFKSISAEFRAGEINTWEYLSYVEQFGLSHLVLELAQLCPDPRKRKELTDAYTAANIRDRSRGENGDASAASLKESKTSNRKGKGKVADRTDNTTTKDALADSFLDTVRKLQLNQKPQEEVEVLSKDGYRAAKSHSNNLASISSSSNSSSQKPAAAAAEENNSKQLKKTSKFLRVRLGDGSAAALLDTGRQNASPERSAEEIKNQTASGSLPVRGVWRNGGGHKLFTDGQQSK